MFSNHNNGNSTMARRLFTAAAATAASLLFAFILFSHQNAELKKQHQVTSEISGHYQFVHPDAWYYLRLARDLKTGSYGLKDPLRKSPLPQPAPPLVQVTDFFSGPSVSSLERTAFYLSPFLAWFMFLGFLAWGTSIGTSWTALTGWAAGAVSAYWIMGTSPGTFDTHAVNALFPLLTAFFLYQTVRVRNAARPFSFLAAVACAIAAWIWWKPGGFLCAGLFGMYGLTFALETTSFERWIKILILAAAALIAGLPFTGYGDLLPDPVRHHIDYLTAHLHLLTGTASDSALISKTVIDELTVTPFTEMAVGLSGSVAGFIISCIGVVALFICRPAAGYFLLPFAALGAYSFFSFRFFIFLLPMLGLGLGFLAHGIAAAARDRFGHPAAGRVIAIALVAAVLAPGLHSAFTRPLNNSVLPPYMHQLAVEAKKHTPPNGMLWTWWSEGYFFQYAANRTTFFDGGRQTPLNNFIAGFALACDKPVVSAGWIKFFTRRGPSALHRLSPLKDNPAPAVDFLLAALSDPSRLGAAADEYDITSRPKLKSYVFPKAKAYVCLPYNAVNSNYWYRSGMWRNRPDPRATITTLSKSRTPADMTHKALLVDGRPVHYGMAVDEGMPFRPPEGFSQRLLIVGKGDTLRLVDPPIYDTLAYRLLGPADFAHPGFTTLYKDPNVGGIWKVE